jgi:carbamoyl-phosphate synthase small subunit
MNTEKNGVIVFNNGEYIYGNVIGANIAETNGELCFNTATTGYQEILTDPSYAKQIIVFSFPHIGNVGANLKDNESTVKPVAQGCVFREMPTNQSNYRANENFEEFLQKRNMLAICNVDTRHIVEKIRKGEIGSCIISRNVTDIQNLIAKVKSLKSTKGEDLASEGSCQQSYKYCDGTKTVAVIDYGIKNNMLELLKARGVAVYVFPHNAQYAEIANIKPDGVLLSNGPGDPVATLPHTKQTILHLMQNHVPIFGICLGHQLIALTLGAKVEKLEQGHRGVNHPVMNYDKKTVEITTQNHGFACLDDNIPKHIEITHRSLFDGIIEGISLKKGIDIEIDGVKIQNSGTVFSVQYHPESSGGPHDSMYLFDNFITSLKC